MRNPLMQRGLIALVQVLAMGVWFSASAVVPALASQWHLSAAAAAWLTAPVQAGFVLGAIISAAARLADRLRPHLLVAGCAAGAAGCTLVMALFAGGPLAAIPLRFATGAFLAGVYPVGMKLMASWSGPAGRALAMGVLIGSLTLGSALPHLIGGWAADRLGRVATAAAALAVSGACCLISPLSFTADRPWLLAFTAVWSAAVIADSGVFSTQLSELVDRRYVGTALTAQTAIGFLLTVVTIQLIPLIASAVGWRYAFLALAAGPLTALPALTSLNRQTKRNPFAVTIERTSP